MLTDTEEILAEVVRRIRDVVHPDRIILFGSRARQDARNIQYRDGSVQCA